MTMLFCIAESEIKVIHTYIQLRLLATVQQNTNFHSHFESLTVYKSTNFDYLRTSFKANVKLVVRKRNVLNKDD